MRCPHCNTGIHAAFNVHQVGLPGLVLLVYSQTCPECSKLIVEAEGKNSTAPNAFVIAPRVPIHPYPRVNRHVPEPIPNPFRKDFTEAILVLSISPKASAALSRRIIQAVLREKANTKAKDLHDQIEEVLKAKSLPSYIADDLHSVRNIGNLAAHETKDYSNGEVIDVEPAEAEWILDLAEAMLDFYFVEPAKQEKRRDELKKKLDAAKKPKLPEPSTDPAKVS